jgi:transketolase
VTGTFSMHNTILDSDKLRHLANEVRVSTVEMSHRGHAAHLGSALSCVDILVTAYFASMDICPDAPWADERDCLILSKGHAVAALYAVLAERGFFPKDWLSTFNEPGTRLPEHPSPRCVPGVEWATGSLGHGLPVAVGMALGRRRLAQGGRFLVVLSDGECEEGSVWEAAMFAASQRLDVLSVIIDHNNWQATGRTCEVMPAMEPLAEKWRAFGWDTVEIDGHDYDHLVPAIGRISRGSGKPLAIVARTVKGKGVSFMEDDNNWHYRVPGIDETAAARKELSRT